MYLYKYLMSSLSQLKAFKIDCGLMFSRIFCPATVNFLQFPITVGAANNRRRCLWEDKCYLSGRSFLKAVVLGWVCRACLIHWLKCHRDEQTIEARGQSSVRTENREKNASEIIISIIDYLWRMSGWEIKQYVKQWFWNNLVQIDLLKC